MYLVKSCFKKDNATRAGTIKIGTLNEYRHTEQKQIADCYEGTFKLHIDLTNVHIETSVFNFINYSHNSYASSHIIQWIPAGQSNAVIGSLFFKKYTSNIELLNFNRFTFCISLLDSPEKCTTIFQDYDDYWYFHNNLAHEIAAAMALSLKEEILIKEEAGIRVFDGDYDVDYLEIRPSIQSINYQDRHLSIDNDFFYKNTKLICDSLKGISYIKPYEFHNEKEVRFIFDFYHKNILLHPNVKMIIIKIPEDINCLIHSM